ncbi:MAG: OmpA family protein [Treponema sp.]|jgi:outer membrane protein OmpA-like peptidoglycan-associated protein|nr:OmpA family protein [Treponema sp.]
MISRCKQLFFIAALTAALVTPLYAQTAQKMENLLNNRSITWAQASAFALEASDKLLSGTEDEAFRFAQEQKWLPENAASHEPAQLDGIALLLMGSFDQNGGMFYLLTKNAHYAYRELVYKNVIQGKSDPEMLVSGEEFLFMINRILSVKEAETESAQRKEEARRRAEEERLAREINAQLAAQNVADTTVSVTKEGVTISLSNIQFRANSAELVASEQTKIREIGRILETVPGRSILIAGHTALAGTREEQLRTSRERAQAVANYLISLRVRTTAEITVQGFGADRPVADNTTPEGMERNRRVEITIIQGGGAR